MVLDASVVALAVVGDANESNRAHARMQGERLYAPELVDLEVASYVRRGVRRREIGVERAALALTELLVLPVSRISHTPLLSRVWELRDNLTSYDAAYVALAETLEAPLLTLDARIARAPGVRCEVVVLS